MSEQKPESHPLLNETAFVDGLFANGHDRAFGRRVFGLLVREAYLADPTRTAESIRYCEENPQGERELVVSLPNMAAQMGEISRFPQIGTTSVEAITQLVAPYMQSVAQQGPSE